MTGPDRRACVILGAGGHARLVIDAIFAAGEFEIEAVIDRDAGLWGSEVLGVPVVGGDDQLDKFVDQGVESFALGVGSSGNTDLKRQVYVEARERGLRPLKVRHPRAVCSSLATLGDGTQIMPNSVIGPGAVLGENVAVNAGAVVEHDCQLADHVFVGTGAVLCGGVEVGEGAFIGAGATVRQMIKIGAETILGAGAVAVFDVPSQVVSVGVPARVVREKK